MSGDDKVPPWTLDERYAEELLGELSFDQVESDNGSLSTWHHKHDDSDEYPTIVTVSPKGTIRVTQSNVAGLPKGRYSLDKLAAAFGKTIESKPESYGETLALPDGCRLWSADDMAQWPTLRDEAWQGPVAEFIDLIAPHIEVAPEPVALGALVKLGTKIGRRARVQIGEHFHHANLYVLVVGNSSTGAKGSAGLATDKLVGAVDLSFFLRHEVAGFGSGEALVRMLRDPEKKEEAEEESKRPEKSRVVVEPEFGRVLRVAHREGSILSHIMRQGFDYGPIQHRTISGGEITATDHHLSVLGSVTPDELRSSTDELELSNGWLNRIMAVRSHLVRHLPFGGSFPKEQVSAVAGRISEALDKLDKASPKGRVLTIRSRGPVGNRWAEWYETVRDGTGPLPALVGRQHVQAARLALILAVIDGSSVIAPEHLDAAIAWVEYSAAVMQHVFGTGAIGRTGRLLEAIRAAGADGLTREAQSAVFHHNVSARELGAMRSELIEANLVYEWKRPSTGGRPSFVSVALAERRKK